MPAIGSLTSVPSTPEGDYHDQISTEDGRKRRNPRKGDRRGLSFRGRGDISVENFGKRKNNGKTFSGIRKCERALICFNQFFFKGFSCFFHGWLQPHQMSAQISTCSVPLWRGSNGDFMGDFFHGILHGIFVGKIR